MRYNKIMLDPSLDKSNPKTPQEEKIVKNYTKK
jgi:hypothetical protein